MFDDEDYEFLMTCADVPDTPVFDATIQVRVYNFNEVLTRIGKVASSSARWGALCPGSPRLSLSTLRASDCHSSLFQVGLEPGVAAHLPD